MGVSGVAGADGVGVGVGGGVEGGGVVGVGVGVGVGVEGLEEVGAEGDGVVGVGGGDVGWATSGVARESLPGKESSTCAVSDELSGAGASSPGDSATCQTTMTATRKTSAAAAPIASLRDVIVF